MVFYWWKSFTFFIESFLDFPFPPSLIPSFTLSPIEPDNVFIYFGPPDSRLLIQIHMGRDPDAGDWSIPVPSRGQDRVLPELAC